MEGTRVNFHYAWACGLGGLLYVCIHVCMYGPYMCVRHKLLVIYCTVLCWSAGQSSVVPCSVASCNVM